jgi:replicative DNA helicase
MDENDKLQAGVLPNDPTEDTKVIPSDAPRVLTVRDLLRGSRLEADRKNKASLTTTGNYKLDNITGGMIPGFVWVFGADTSWGKSSFLVMLVDENLKRNKRTLVVSAEDSEKLYGDRLMLRRTRHQLDPERDPGSRLSANLLRAKKIKPEMREQMLQVEDRAEEAPVFLDARGRGVEWVSRNVKQIIKEQQIDVVAYDYLQAFDNEKPQQDRRNQVTYIARTLTDITKSLDKTGIIFSQITIEKGKAVPDKHSIRESRDVSNAAEVVLLGFVPEKDITAPSREPGRPAELLVSGGERAIFVDKCKNGPRGALIPMPWDNDSACFDTVVDPETERLRKAADAAGDFSEFDDADWRDR